MHDVLFDDFLSLLGGGNISDISYAIANTGNVKWVYYFLLKILEQNISDIEQASSKIYKSFKLHALGRTGEVTITDEDKLIITNSLKDINAIDIEYLRDIIVNSSDAEFMYKYMRDIKPLYARLVNIIEKDIEDIDDPFFDDNLVFDVKRTILNIKDEDLSNEINNTKKLKYIVKYASDVRGSDTKLLLNTALKSRNAKYIYLFAKNVGIDITRCQNEIIDIGNAKYIYLFARDVKGADVRLLAEAILGIDSPKYIYLFSKDIDGINQKIFLDVLLDFEDGRYTTSYAKNVSTEEIDKLEEAATDSYDSEYIYNLAIAFYNKMKEEKDFRIKARYRKALKRLSIAIRNTKDIDDSKYIYLYALNIKGIKLTALENCIVRLGSAEYMYLYALNIPNADVKFIEMRIFGTKDIYWIYKFVSEVHGADIPFAISRIISMNLDPEGKYLESLRKIQDERTPKKKEEVKVKTKTYVDPNVLIDEAITKLDAKELYRCARKYKTRLDEISEALLKTDDLLYICKFVYNMKWVNIFWFEEKIVDSGNAEYIYKFALNIRGANIDRLAKALIKTCDVKYIELFSRIYPNIYDILNSKNVENNFLSAKDLVEEGRHKDIYEMLVSYAYRPNISLKYLSDLYGIPEEKLLKTILEIRLRYQAISYNADRPLDRSDIAKYGRMYKDIDNLIDWYRKCDIEDRFVHTLIENYYLEDGQSLKRKARIRKPIKNNQF